LGRALLAALPASRLNEHLKQLKIKKYTKFTLTTKPALKAAILKAGQQGYALVNEELEIGLRSLAVPVRNHDNRVVASLNVGVQAARMGSRKMIKDILPVLQDASQELKSQLIY
jgi:IclR family pca regulon transcriptional regulator